MEGIGIVQFLEKQDNCGLCENTQSSTIKCWHKKNRTNHWSDYSVCYLIKVKSSLLFVFPVSLDHCIYCRLGSAVYFSLVGVLDQSIDIALADGRVVFVLFSDFIQLRMERFADLRIGGILVEVF